MHIQKHQTVQLKVMHATKLLWTVWLVSFQNFYLYIIHEHVLKKCSTRHRVRLNVCTMWLNTNGIMFCPLTFFLQTFNKLNIVFWRTSHVSTSRCLPFFSILKWISIQKILYGNRLCNVYRSPPFRWAFAFLYFISKSAVGIIEQSALWT